MARDAADSGADRDAMFPADAVIRQLSLEPVVYLGMGRALLMQLAHPRVAEGVDRHSAFEHDAVSRLTGTMKFLSAVVFGSRREADQAAARVRRVHGRVVGAGYSAADPALLTWVNATLIDTVLRCHAAAHGPLPIDRVERYYQEATVVAGILGCPRESQPADFAAFRVYLARMIRTLRVGETGRRLGRAVLAGAGLPIVLRPAVPVLRFVTVGLLPVAIRHQYDLSWGPGRDQLLGAVLRGGGALTGALPGPPGYR